MCYICGKPAKEVRNAGPMCEEHIRSQLEAERAWEEAQTAGREPAR